MKIIYYLLLFCGILFAKDEIIEVDLEKILDSTTSKEILGDEVEFVFGSGSDNTKAILTNIISNKKTSKTSKDSKFDTSLSGKHYEFYEYEKACGWVLLSNLKELKEQALRHNGAKVVNIISYYKKVPFNSKDKFQCAIGSMMIGVALKGDVIR